MADGTRDEDGQRGKTADEAALSARLGSLRERLGHIGASRSVEDGRHEHRADDLSGIARGMRLSAELVGGVIAGSGLGWIFDRLFGTSPWGFIGLLLLGFAAGVLSDDALCGDSFRTTAPESRARGVFERSLSRT